MVEKILEVSGKKKVTWIGYSNGNAQINVSIPGLSEKYWAPKLNKFIALAPCTQWNSVYNQPLSSIESIEVHYIVPMAPRSRPNSTCVIRSVASRNQRHQFAGPITNGG